MNISPADLEQNRQLHADNEDYGTSGRKWAAYVAAVGNALACDTILDYGCGKGTLKAAINDGRERVSEYDPAVPGKDAAPAAADLVVCTDVMEHVPEAGVDGVLAEIAALALKAAFFAIATVPAHKFYPDGRNAHLTVRPATWWHATLDRHLHVKEFRDESGNFIAVCVKRPAATVN